MVSVVNEVSATWADAMVTGLVSGTIAIGVVGVADWLLGRTSCPAWARNWLWRLVAFKLLLAVVISKPISLPILSPVVSSASTAVVDVDESVAAKLERDSLVGVAPMPNLSAMQERGTFSSNTNISASQDQAMVGETKLFPNWLGFLLFAWLIGVVANLGIFGRQLFLVSRMQLEPIVDPKVLGIVSNLAEEQGIRPPPVCTSKHASGPLLVGFFRPTIVLDERTLGECTAEQLQSVIAHEFAHCIRRDLWWNLLPVAVHTIYFFHPFVWFANYRHRVTSEMACDLLAIRGAKQTPSQYAKSLLQIATFGSDRIQSRRLLGAVAVFHSLRSLKQRMNAMKDARVVSKRRAVVIACGILLVGLLGVVPWQPVHRAIAADPPEANEDAKPSKESPSKESMKTFGENMSFDERKANGSASGWYGGGKGYKRTTDKSSARSKGFCALIEGESESGFGTFTQCMDAEELRGKRVVLSGFLKSDLGDQGDGGLWLRVDAGDRPVGFDNMSDRRVKGKTDWNRHEIVLDVPTEATRVCFGFLMTGSGKLYADDLEFTFANDETKTTDAYMTKLREQQSALRNGDFELASESPRLLAEHWGGGGEGYELSRDTDVKHSGEASGRIKGTENAGAFASITQVVAADDYRGKRLELSAFVKTDSIRHSGLWMRVDGEDDKCLAFDNMGDRPIKGTTGWTKHSVVLDIDETAQAIALGYLASGQGTCWCDDFELTVHDPKSGPKTTGQRSDKPDVVDLNNGNFDAAHAGQHKVAADWGGGGNGYELQRDEAVKHSGLASGRIKKTSGAGTFGTFTQMFVAQKYKGKRVRLSGYLKTEDAEQTGLWLRVDGPGKNPLGFDNMSRRPVKGTTDWTKYEVVLDVPESATYLAMGFLLVGDGTTWADELQLEIVGELGQGPDTTNMLSGQ